MELYLAADSGRLQQAMACTTQLAHMSYRIGPGGTLLASPLPDTLRGGLLMLSDEGGTYPDAPEGLCRQQVQECLHRRYAGVILEAAPPESFCRTLDELLARQERRLYLPEGSQLTNQELGDILAAYIQLLDDSMKEFFQDLQDPQEGARQVEKMYATFLKNGGEAV